MLEVSTVSESRFQNGICVGPFQKKSKQEKGQKWWKTPRIFTFVSLPLEIPDKVKLHPWEFYKIMLHPLEFQVKNQEPWRFHIIFSGSPFQTPLLFYWPLRFPHSVFLITLELPCPQPSPVWMFSGRDHWKSGEKNKYIYIYIANEVMGAATVDSQ